MAVNIKKCLRNNILTVLLVLSIFIGVGLGFTLRHAKTDWTSREIMYVIFPGNIFLRMLKCLVLPLIISSLISAIGNLDLRLSGKIGYKAIVYYLSTTIIAVVLGITLVYIIEPGKQIIDDVPRYGTSRNITVEDTIFDLIRNMVPPNIVEACIYQYHTVLIAPEVNENSTAEEKANAASIYRWKITNEHVVGTNILGIVFVSIIFGIILSVMRDNAGPLLRGFTCLTEAIMILTKWVIWLSPIGIIFLVAGKIIEMKNFAIMIGQLGLYTGTILIGLFIHGVIILPLIYFAMTRKRPFRFIVNMSQALATAWATSSSSATLPVTIQCLEEKNLLDPRIVRFVIPVGATINMDGTALYEAVAAIFISQLHDMQLDVGQIIIVSITATIASVGAAGIPQAGLITMVMVLNAIGLPAQDVTLIVVVDWFLDRFRTMVNVLGDSLGAGIIDHLSKKDLDSALQRSQPTASQRTLGPGEVV